jgi:MoxR-like ATPase
MKAAPGLYERVLERLVGRRRETRVVLSALQSGRNIFLEGPPGTSKSTMLKAVVEEAGLPFYWVTGNSDLTATKLLGNFDPALVLSEGYKAEHFEYGALTSAMREGGILYVEEFNRLPDDTSNAFITAISERAVPVPRLGKVEAKPEFRVVACLNPYDDAGTLRISRALRDRFCSVWMDYQSKEEEIAIVMQQLDGQEVPEWINLTLLVETSVEMSRRTRSHEDIRLGASVRGAIDMSLLGLQLLVDSEAEIQPQTYSELIRMAAHAALRDKMWLNEVSDRKLDDVIDDLWDELASESDIDDDDAWRIELDDIKKKGGAGLT